MLAPGETVWEIPPGSSPDAPLRAARRGVLNGITHALGHGVHFALIAVVSLLGSATLIGRFSAGQIVAVAVAALAGIRLDPNLGELGLALGVVLLAREALRAKDERRQITGLAVASGAVHGLGLAGFGAAGGMGFIQTGLMALGMDVTLLLMVAVGLVVLQRVSYPRVMAYGVGSVTVTLGLLTIVTGPATSTEARGSASRLPGLANASAMPASSRIAPSTPDAPIQSFVAIEAFEVRHEVLMRVAELADELGLDRDGVIEVEAQGRVKELVRELGLSASAIAVDGEPREPIEARVDFMTVDAQGALPRQTPVRETVEDAYVGFTVSHLTKTTPQQVHLTWKSFLDAAPTIPSTMIDPETTRAALLTSEATTMKWENALAEDPVPSVEAVSVEPTLLPLPLASIPLALASLFFACVAMRGTRVPLAIRSLEGRP